MNKPIKSFIEKFIRDNANKDNQFGYDLSTKHDLSIDAQNELIRGLIKLDKENLRQLILDHAQTLIDERILIVEAEDRYDSGLIAKIDPINGEVTFSLGSI
ncbi:MAG TPA: hypothetical protein VNX68_02220 [Nitrosopumilaceae archaeon]|jgi:hypothetical protein|nr:hypothetical protein [Nitrosopumilaceae archaeon]